MNNYQRGKGSYYTDITRVILINLNWYPLKKGLNIPGKKIYEIPYSDNVRDGYLFKMINVNLDYYTKLCYDKIDIKDKLYNLLTVKNKEELNYLIKTEQLLDRYSHKLIDLSKNTEYVEEIMSEEMEKFLEAHMEYQSDLSEGKAKNQKEIVLNMYHDNVNLETISKYTKLSILEIEKIISEERD